MPCFFSTNGDGLDGRAARLRLLDWLVDTESVGNKLDAVPRRLATADSWAFEIVSLLRFPLVVAAISWCDVDKDLLAISPVETASRKRPIACTNAAQVGAREK